MGTRNECTKRIDKIPTHHISAMVTEVYPISAEFGLIDVVIDDEEKVFGFEYFPQNKVHISDDFLGKSRRGILDKEKESTCIFYILLLIKT